MALMSAPIIQRREVHVADNLGVDWRTFCPPCGPSSDLARWLWLLTPTSAPLVPVVVENAPQPPHPGYMPLLYRLAQPPVTSWPHRKRDAEIAARLPAGVHRKPGHQAPRAGKERWQMETAWHMDIHGQAQAEAAATLDLCDESYVGKAGSRSVRRYRLAGRAILSRLGAWPWCLDEAGELEERWWETKRYAEALAAWHFDAFRNAVNDLLGTVELAAGRDLRWRTDANRLDHARQLYADWYADWYARTSHAA